MNRTKNLIVTDRYLSEADHCKLIDEVLSLKVALRYTLLTPSIYHPFPFLLNSSFITIRETRDLIQLAETPVQRNETTFQLK